MSTCEGREMCFICAQPGALHLPFARVDGPGSGSALASSSGWERVDVGEGCA